MGVRPLSSSIAASRRCGAVKVAKDCGEASIEAKDMVAFAKGLHAVSGGPGPGDRPVTGLKILSRAPSLSPRSPSKVVLGGG